MDEMVERSFAYEPDEAEITEITEALDKAFAMYFENAFPKEYEAGLKDDAYLTELYLKLAIAKELGGSQTVYWNEGNSLPFYVMKLLNENPDITLVFDYIYNNCDCRVVLNGEDIKVEPEVNWFGPDYLYAIYGGHVINNKKCS